MNTATATPTKLKSGAWGARVQGTVKVGDTVTITTRAGKSWDARVTQVIWTGDGVSIAATESLDPKPRAAAPVSAVASIRGGARAPAGNNRKAGNCDRCGHYLQPGQGHLERCYADTGCMQHFDDDGWHLGCADRTACDARVTENRERAEKAKAATEELRKLAAGAEASWEPHEGGRGSWDTSHKPTFESLPRHPNHWQDRFEIVPTDQAGGAPGIYWVHPTPNNADGWDTVAWRCDYDAEVAARLSDLYRTAGSPERLT